MLLHDRKRDDKKYLNLLKRHCDVEEELLALFCKEKIEIEDLKDKILSLQEIREETLYLFERKSGGEEDKEREKDNERKLLNISGSIVKQKEFDSQTIESYNSAKNEISAVYKTISENKTPVLNLHAIKDFLKNISPYFLSSISFEEDVNIEGVITILSSQSKDEDNSLILKNGRRVTITARNCDFTDFSYNELIEILRFFDTLVSDSSLDYLRTEIVKQINAITNVSLIKF